MSGLSNYERPPRNIEDAQFILQKRGLPSEIIEKTFFGIPVRVIKITDNPKTYLFEVDQEYLKAFIKMAKTNYEVISGSGRTLAFLIRAYLLRDRKGEGRSYPNLCLKNLFFSRAMAEAENKDAIHIIESVIERLKREALQMESEEVLERDAEDFKALASDLVQGLEEFK